MTKIESVRSVNKMPEIGLFGQQLLTKFFPEPQTKPTLGDMQRPRDIWLKKALMEDMV